MRTMWIGLAIMAMVGCEEDAETKDQETVANQQKQYQIAQPLHWYDWSLERHNALQLYDLRNEEVTTYTVWRGDTSIIEGDCSSIGYPLPYDTSLTNPLQVGWSSSQGGAGVIEQAEPNGVFASKNSTATWIMCTGEDGIEPTLVESKVTTYSSPQVVDYSTNTVTRLAGAKSSATIKPKK